MRRLFALALVLAASFACGDSPTSPSVATTTSSTPSPAVAANPAPTPSAGTTQGPVPSATGWYRIVSSVSGTVHQWTLTVTNAPVRFHIVALSHHSDSTNGGATLDRPGSLFRISGATDYAVGSSGTTTLTFDSSEAGTFCGRFQLDASIVYEDGTTELIVGELMRTGTDCDPPPPPPPPPPTLTSCKEFITVQSVNNGTATFTILPGGYVELSLVSYTVTPGMFLPQAFYSVQHGTFAAGPHQITVATPGQFQADLYCGPYPEGVDLNESNYAYWSSFELGSEINVIFTDGLRMHQHRP